jgi:Undecaprenyl-phosphate glucose phosphotransferase
MIKKHQRLFNSLMVLIDAAVLSFAYMFVLKQGEGTKEMGLLGLSLYHDLIWVVPIVLASFYLLEIYSPMRSKTFSYEALFIVRAFFVGIAAIYLVLFITGKFEGYQQFLVAYGLMGFCLIILERYIIRKSLRVLRGRGYNLKHLLIIGAGPIGSAFAEKILLNREFGYNIIGFLDDDPRKHGTKVHGFPVFAGTDGLHEILVEKCVDEIIIALPLRAHERYEEIVDACEREGTRVRIIPDFYGFATVNSRIDEMDGIPLINIRSIPLDDPLKRFVKRGLDIIFSLTAIIVTSPAMLAIAAGVKLSSPGPVLFRQERIGLNNRPFNMLKFRSMRMIDDVTAATRWTTADDPRKTSFGSFIRKTSLDELPQFFNVLLGEMSIVGPRPERPFFVNQFKKKVPKYMVKHQVKPGITGLAQVNGWRGDTSIEKRIECDIYYIENWNLFLDIKIMIRTMFIGLVNRNAY